MNPSRAARHIPFACLVALGALTLAGCASTSKKPDAAPVMKAAFWPAPPDEPRIQFLGAFNSSDDVAPVKSSDFEKLIFGKEAVRVAFVNKPYGVAIRAGTIYICDIRAKALVVMDLVKKQTRLVGVTGITRLERPIAVDIADNGEIFVADGVHGAILVFDPSERFSRALTIPKLKPSSIALKGNRLYVSDMERQQVLILDRETGKELGAIGSVGDEPGQFRLPIGVSVDQAGNVFVTDMMRCNVQKFTADGGFIASVGQMGDHAGGFARPKHLAVDSEGIVYVVDSSFQNVQMFNADFELLMHFGSAGDFPGAMNLPVGIAVTDQGIEYFQTLIHPGFNARRLIVVANQFGDGLVSVYALGERRPSFSLAELRATSAEVSTGVGTPSAASLRFQTIGGIEPPPDDGAPEAAPPEPTPRQ
jgi:sugar lactone lactonase YvrE